MTHEKTRLLYIMSPGHSGSTMLCMLLGATTGWLATGELQRLPWQLSRRHEKGDSVEARTLCTCGRSFKDCPVWGKAVPPEAFEDALANFNLSFLQRQEWTRAGERRPKIRIEAAYRRLASSPFHPLAGLIRPFKAAEIARRNWELIDRAAEVTGAPAVIDASKFLTRYHMLTRRRPAEMVVLIRDVRGVASSAVKWDRDPVQSSINWLRYYERVIEYIEANGIRPAVVRYEDACADPEGVVQSVARAFDLPIANEPLTEFHLVAGNPTRYRPFVIKRDDSWRERLDPDTLDKIAAQLPRCDAVAARLASLAGR